MESNFAIVEEGMGKGRMGKRGFANVSVSVRKRTGFQD